MPRGSARSVLHYLRGLVLARGAVDLTDAQLLDRFTRQNDEGAFEAIVQRHGPLVWGVCRRVLGDRVDAEDAFQATFLVLIRKAGSLARRELLGNWLYGVAYRIALRARQSAAWQPLRLAQEALDAAPARTEAEDVRELGQVLDEEVQRLPVRYRQPFVLCYLQGLTNEQAAHHLGCPKGTVLSRLSRARERLRTRLERRGIAVTGALLTALLAPNAEAAVPPLLVESTVRSGLLLAAGEAAAGVLSARALALSEGVLRVMFISKCRMALLAFVFLGACGGLGLHVLRQNMALAHPADSKDRENARNAAHEAGPLVKIPAPRDGILLLKDAQHVSPGDEKKGEQASSLTRAVRTGEFVAEGQLLAKLDDRLSRDEVTICKAVIRETQAALLAAEKTRDELHTRWQTAIKLRGAGQGAISNEDLRGAKLAYDRCLAETLQKEERVKLAMAELTRAEALVRLHEIRSPAAGIIRAIERQHGEAVRQFETVFLLEHLTPEAAKAHGAKSRPWTELAAQREGTLIAIGTPSEGKVVAGAGFVIDLAGHAQAYRTIREGDAVEAGQILGQIDDRLARTDLEAARARLQVAEEAVNLAQKSLETAKLQLQRVEQMGNKQLISKEQMETTVLAVERQKIEVRTKELEIWTLRTEVARAQAIVEMHVIRSPVKGRLETILKKQGEMVRAFDPVFRVVPDDAAP